MSAGVRQGAGAPRGRVAFLVVLGGAALLVPERIAAAVADAPLVDSAVIATAITAAAGIAVAAIASLARRRGDRHGDRDGDVDEAGQVAVPRQRQPGEGGSVDDRLLDAMLVIHRDNQALKADVDALSRKVDELSDQLLSKDRRIAELERLLATYQESA